ncbi:MAG: mechanosensitive ion channel [Microscillaceae bacterium]|nr:mechanosensitive ion channel [Microscillaceae bacterium]
MRKNLDAEGISFIKHAYNILLILNITILLLRLIIVVREVVLSYYELDGDDDNLSSRKIVTQLRVIERIISFIVIITSIALILMTFKTIREVGISILASAGVIGIVIGFAAQKSIANIVAGIQLAFAQPIRLDDIVIVENEWGRIEEITLTYVVVKLWDERRLIVPLNYFIEKPFQNWTRHSSDLIGSVIFYTDYTVPLDALREEFRRLLANHPLWDKRNSNLQVTDANKSSLEIRVLMSAENAGEVFNLRCDIREGLITFLQKNYPNSLPKSRIEITNNLA